MLISDSETLGAFCEALRGAPYIAVDTEFMREKTYFARLCLVQVAHGERFAAIDTLAAGLDLRPLGELLRDPAIVKVFHAAPQDLEIFFHEMGSVPAPVFDTQIAASVCGLGEQPGYATLVDKLVGAEIDKSSQITDWSLRPLSERQLAYALSDVTHLCTIYEYLCDELAARGRAAWVEEEMEGLTDEGRYRVEPREVWRRVKVRRPRPKTLAVLRELAAWREETAMARNLPRKWVLRDEALVEIAQHLPRSADGLERVRGLSAKQANGDEGVALLEAVDRALALPESEWPSPPKRSRRASNDSLVALLQALLRLRCDESGVAMSMVATRKDLDKLAAPREAGEAQDLPALKGWRREVFGADALALCEGRLALSARGGEVVALRLEG